jgi:hypothetical protein
MEAGGCIVGALVEVARDIRCPSLSEKCEDTIPVSDGISSNLPPLGKKKSTKIGKPGDGAERGAWGKALAAPRACHMMKPALVPIQSRKHERTKSRNRKLTCGVS